MPHCEVQLILLHGKNAEKAQQGRKWNVTSVY